jgi:hypothetical protein
VLIVATVIALLMWKPFVKLHSRLQIALVETLAEDKGVQH